MRKYFKLITLLILVGIILSACNNGYSNKAITSLEEAVNGNQELGEYLSEARIKKAETSSLEGYKFHDYKVLVNANDNFDKLSDEQKFEVFEKLEDSISKEKIKSSIINCGKKEICTIDHFQISFESDIYEYKKTLINI